METFDQMDKRIKAEVRRDELDEGGVTKKPLLRYCMPCDRWMRVRVCKACGSDTER